MNTARLAPIMASALRCRRPQKRWARLGWLTWRRRRQTFRRGRRRPAARKRWLLSPLCGCQVGATAALSLQGGAATGRLGQRKLQEPGRSRGRKPSKHACDYRTLSCLSCVPSVALPDLDRNTIIIPTAAAPLLEGQATRLDHSLDTNGEAAYYTVVAAHRHVGCRACMFACGRRLPCTLHSSGCPPCVACRAAGIIYLDLALDFARLPPDLLPLVPLFCT